MGRTIEFRELSDEASDEVEEEIGNRDSTPALVEEYLHKIYELTKEEAAELVKKYMKDVLFHCDSHVYYTAGLIVDKEMMDVPPKE